MRCSGCPSAGNVMRPGTSVKVSLRLPAHMDPDDATTRLKNLLESDPPYGARVTFTPEQSHGTSSILSRSSRSRLASRGELTQ